MAKKSAAKKSTAKQDTMKHADLDQQDIVVFQGPKPVTRPGTVQLHSFGSVVDKIFGRTVDDVKADFDKVSAQLDAILANAFSKVTAGMTLDSVEISLGFTAEGKLAFIAQAGVEASVTVTFTKA
ncbi:MAG TPA: hypothetical protein VHT28_12940 [Silvibacterium sp.]|jgi:hypothetical protein|nr:hypothetical protein [Silvibacterium sp.]